MLKIKDAYIHGDDNGQRWTIGTNAVEQVFECKTGRFRLASFKNKLVSPWLEYADAQASGSLFEPDAGPLLARFDFDKLWSAIFRKGETVCRMGNISLQVKQGEILGFRIDKMNQDAATVLWPISLDYEDGTPDEIPGGAKLSDGDMYTLAAGDLNKLEDKIPGAVRFNLGNQSNMMRIWKAPCDGRIRIGGELSSAAHGNLDVGVYRITEKTPEAVIHSECFWTIENGSASEVAVGGRPAAQLDLKLKSQRLCLHLHLLVYPDTSIIRQWLEIENSGAEPIVLKSPASLLMNLCGNKDAPWLNYWMIGADGGLTQGQLKKALVNTKYRNSLTGERTEQFVPWTALQHENPAGDGCFVSSESLSAWNMSILRDNDSTVRLAVSMLSWANCKLQAGERIELQPLTIGVFAGGLDDMGARVYDWQYQYLWDYTNPDYYARTQYMVPWFYCSRNLQEQFAGRIAGLDMDGADHARATGFDMLWDDAGWAKYPQWPVPDNYGSVFHQAYEGPDFSQTQQYLRKMRAKWILWFCGRPSPGTLDAKIASWGDFQWRTDGVGSFNPANEKLFRENIKRFLDRHPRSSFHTCDGGSRYAHTFEIQRYADLNYLADRRGDETNYYFSYLDTPDKWMDGCEVYPDFRYKPGTSRRMLTAIPCWYTKDDADTDDLRRLNELYHYLLKEGVAGRWSYVFHPAVTGDKEYYYFQRTNHDRTKACIILKHRAEGEVKIYPRGLLPEHQYVVGFDSTTDTTSRSGADLMTNGIVIKDQKPGELVYLGLPHRPGAPADKTAVNEPGRVFKRFETNLGHSGVGIYWSPGTGENWISYYEVRRAGKILGKTSIGNFFFDHSAGWDCAAAYSVRAVGGNGTMSDWKPAEQIEGEALTFSALGGHFSERGRDGWSAETTTDGKVFQPMTWVAPVKNPAGDRGGTPNQTGGVEGYWEGAETARVGRGWQQASLTAACVRAWTAPRPGTVRVIGRATKEYYRQSLGKDSLHAAILLGERQVWPGKGLAEIRPDDLEGAVHDLTLQVKAGDVIRFVLEPGLDPDNDIVAWIPRIVYAGDAVAKQECSTVRILCGADADTTDACGNVWVKDAFCKGGEVVSTKEMIEDALPTRDDMRLYQLGREGEDFTYAIPVKPGLYSIRLKFAETRTQWMYERPIHVTINGQQVLTNFDVCHTVKGSRKACEKTFHNIIPDAKGLINLRFSAGTDPLQVIHKAMVQAIEVLPELRPTIRINCGAESPFVDWNSDVWAADAFFEGGQAISSNAKVTRASPTIYDQKLYQTARSGKHLVYRIVAPDGLYTVHLKFAELWLKETGKRPMNLEVNGLRIRENWDPAQAAGELAGHAADIRVEDVTPDVGGHITVRISATGENDAVLQGVEIE